MIRLLYIPSRILVTPKPKWFETLLGALRQNKNVPINGELNHVGELFDMGSLVEVHCPFPIHEIYFCRDRSRYDNISNHQNYPSNFDFVRPISITLLEAISDISYYSAALVSIDSPSESKALIRECKRRGVPVFYIDKFDHPEVYVNSERSRTLLCRGVEDFAGYFKQDYPITYEYNDVFPLAPVPVRGLNLSEIELINVRSYSYDYETAFIGDYRSGVTRQDRRELIDALLSAGFRVLLSYGSNKRHYTQAELDEIYKNVIFNISPCGKVWDSYRHVEFAKYGRPMVLPRPDCHIVGPNLRDSHDAILYDLKIRDGDFSILDVESLIEKIGNLMADKNKCSRMSNNYLDWVSASHTRVARARYILATISKVLS